MLKTQQTRQEGKLKAQQQIVDAAIKLKAAQATAKQAAKKPGKTDKGD